MVTLEINQECFSQRRHEEMLEGVSSQSSCLVISAPMTDDLVQSICETNCEPQRLVFQRQRASGAGDQVVAALCNSSLLSFLRELEFQECAFDVSIAQFQQLFRAILATTSLEKLVLSKCLLDWEVTNYFAPDYLLEVVVLILEAYDKPISIQALHFTDFTSKHVLIQRLVKLLSTVPNSVRELRLAVEDQGAESIASALLRTPFVVERLILESGQIGNAGAAALGRALAAPECNLCCLNLRGNHRITVKGAMALETGLRRNTTLIALELDDGDSCSSWTTIRNRIQAYCQANHVLREWSCHDPPPAWIVAALATHPAALFAWLQTFGDAADMLVRRAS